MVIHCMHVAHAMRNEFVVETGSKLRARLDTKRDDAFFRVRQQHKEGRAVVAREVDANVKPASGDRTRGRDPGKSAWHHEELVYTRDCGRERFALGGQNKRN